MTGPYITPSSLSPAIGIPGSEWPQTANYITPTPDLYVPSGHGSALSRQGANLSIGTTAFQPQNQNYLQVPSHSLARSQGSCQITQPTSRTPRHALQTQASAPNGTPSSVPTVAGTELGEFRGILRSDQASITYMSGMERPTLAFSVALTYEDTDPDENCPDIHLRFKVVHPKSQKVWQRFISCPNGGVSERDSTTEKDRCLAETTAIAKRLNDDPLFPIIVTSCLEVAITEHATKELVFERPPQHQLNGPRDSIADAFAYHLETFTNKHLSIQDKGVPNFTLGRTYCFRTVASENKHLLYAADVFPEGPHTATQSDHDAMLKWMDRSLLWKGRREGIQPITHISGGVLE